MHVEESFATASDGTRLWWRSAGAGAPVLLCDGIGCAGYVWRHVFPQLAGRGRALHWNYRGHGRSERPPDDERVTLSDAVDDLFAILDAAGEPAAVLMGHSLGVQLCLEAHRRRPERVRALVLVCGAPGRLLRTFHGRAVLEGLFPWIRAAVVAAPEAARWFLRAVAPTELSLQVARLLEVNRHLIRREDLEAYLRELAATDPEVFVRMLGDAARHDASDHLASVDVPTLVVAGERDTFTPVSLSARMHAAIPASDYLVLPGGSHMAPLERPELVAARLERFLAERVGAAGSVGGRPARRRRAARARRG